jgi:hypothetical protein
MQLGLFESIVGYQVLRYYSAVDAVSFTNFSAFVVLVNYTIDPVAN